jgi:hypothetical protein
MADLMTGRKLLARNANDVGTSEHLRPSDQWVCPPQITKATGSIPDAPYIRRSSLPWRPEIALTRGNAPRSREEG